MIEIKHTNGEWEFVRFLPGVDQGLVVVKDGRTPFQRHLDGEDWREALQ